METKFNFGKYKNRLVSAVPITYCEWLYENVKSKPNEQLRRALAKRIGAEYLPLPSDEDRRLTDFILGI